MKKTLVIIALLIFVYTGMKENWLGNYLGQLPKPVTRSAPATPPTPTPPPTALATSQTSPPAQIAVDPAISCQNLSPTQANWNIDKRGWQRVSLPPQTSYVIDVIGGIETETTGDVLVQAWGMYDLIKVWRDSPKEWNSIPRGVKVLKFSNTSSNQSIVISWRNR